MSDSTASPAPTFADEVVRAIVSHMNTDHVEDTLLIVRSLGHENATNAAMVGFDGDGADFTADSPAGPVTVRVPWRQRISERAQVRSEIVWLHEQAEAARALTGSADD